MSQSSGRVALCADVDNCILNTTSVHDELSAYISRQLGINAAAFRSEISQFDPNHRGYRLDAHLQHYGSKLSDLREPMLECLSAAPLLYDDAITALRAAARQPQVDIHLLTVGNFTTQAFEVDLVIRMLELYRVCTGEIMSTILDEPKGPWLARQWTGGLTLAGLKYRRIILIDDNPGQFDGLSATPGFTGFQIRRQLETGGYRYDESQNSLIRPIFSLEEVLKYLS